MMRAEHLVTNELRQDCSRLMSMRAQKLHSNFHQRRDGKKKSEAKFLPSLWVRFVAIYYQPVVYYWLGGKSGDFVVTQAQDYSECEMLNSKLITRKQALKTRQ